MILIIYNGAVKLKLLVRLDLRFITNFDRATVSMLACHAVGPGSIPGIEHSQFFYLN